MIGTDDGSQEKESHWLPLIGFKDDMKFTPQNHSAVKGQTPCKGAFLWENPNPDSCIQKRILRFFT